MWSKELLEEWIRQNQIWRNNKDWGWERTPKVKQECDERIKAMYEAIAQLTSKKVKLILDKEWEEIPYNIWKYVVEPRDWEI